MKMLLAREDADHYSSAPTQRTTSSPLITSTLIPTHRIREHLRCQKRARANLVSGDKLQIIANGTVSEDIEAGATVFLQVKYGLITLIKQEADLCDHLGEVCASRTTISSYLISSRSICHVH